VVVGRVAAGVAMNDRVIVIVGFAVVGVLTLTAIVVSWLRSDLVATIAETVDWLTARRWVRIVAVLIWGWVGWHFLAR
jgi:hypothetical protein